MTSLPASSPGDATVGARDLELLVQFSSAFPSLDLRGFESAAEALERDLSPEAGKLFASVVRRRIVPMVAGLVDGVCAACNVAVPTGLASAILARGGIHACHRCKRILRPMEADQLLERRAAGSAP
jgi:hypothetical protein